MFYVLIKLLNSKVLTGIILTLLPFYTFAQAEKFYGYEHLWKEAFLRKLAQEVYVEESYDKKVQTKYIMGMSIEHPNSELCVNKEAGTVESVGPFWQNGDRLVVPIEYQHWSCRRWLVDMYGGKGRVKEFNSYDAAANWASVTFEAAGEPYCPEEKVKWETRQHNTSFVVEFYPTIPVEHLDETDDPIGYHEYELFPCDYLRRSINPELAAQLVSPVPVIHTAELKMSGGEFSGSGIVEK